MEHLTLQLSIEEVNKILTALGKQPFVEVHELITKIQNQSVPQLQQLQEQREAKPAEKSGS